MTDFIFHTIPLAVLYFVLRYVFRSSERHNKKIFIFYAIVAFVWILMSFSDIESKGIEYFLYADLIPAIIPFILHLVFLFAGKRKRTERKLKYNNKEEKITTLLTQKVIITSFILISTIANVLLIIFTDHRGIYLVFIISLTLFIIFLIINLFFLFRYKYQRIIVIKGKTKFEVLVYDLPQSSIFIKVGSILSTNKYSYNYIGTALVLDLEKKRFEQHYVFRINTDEFDEIKPLELVKNHYYEDFNIYFDQVNNQKFSIIIDENQIVDFKSK